jgi:hypothetical protein
MARGKGLWVIGIGGDSVLRLIGCGNQPASDATHPLKVQFHDGGVRVLGPSPPLHNDFQIVPLPLVCSIYRATGVFKYLSKYDRVSNFLNYFPENRRYCMGYLLVCLGILVIGVILFVAWCLCAVQSIHSPFE